MKRKYYDLIINIEALYLSMATVFLCMSIIRLLMGQRTSHEVHHLIISSIYLIIGVVLFMKEKK